MEKFISIINFNLTGLESSWWGACAMKSIFQVLMSLIYLDFEIIWHFLANVMITILIIIIFKITIKIKRKIHTLHRQVTLNQSQTTVDQDVKHPKVTLGDISHKPTTSPRSLSNIVQPDFLIAKEEDYDKTKVNKYGKGSSLSVHLPFNEEMKKKHEASSSVQPLNFSSIVTNNTSRSSNARTIFTQDLTAKTSATINYPRTSKFNKAKSVIPVVAIYDIPKSQEAAYYIYNHILNIYGKQSGIKCVKVLIDNVKAITDNAIAFVFLHEDFKLESNFKKIVELFKKKTHVIENKKRILNASINFNTINDYYSRNTSNSNNADLVTITYQVKGEKSTYNNEQRSLFNDLANIEQAKQINPARGVETICNSSTSNELYEVKQPSTTSKLGLLSTIHKCDQMAKEFNNDPKHQDIIENQQRDKLCIVLKELKTVIDAETGERFTLKYRKPRHKRVQPSTIVQPQI
jgi:hypothetical protein